MTINWAKLKEPFKGSEIEWRVGRKWEKNGKAGAFVLVYLTARAVMDRLDEACGPGGWSDRINFDNKGCTCTIEVFDDNNLIHRQDAAPFTDIEAYKGAASDAFKRAAVKFGIGRYLYDLGDTHVEITTEKLKGANYVKMQDGSAGYWMAPQLPAWALPPGAAPKPPAQAPTPPKVMPQSKVLPADSIVNPVSAKTAPATQGYPKEYAEFPWVYQIPPGKEEAMRGSLKKDGTIKWNPSDKVWHSRERIMIWDQYLVDEPGEIEESPPAPEVVAFDNDIPF